MKAPRFWYGNNNFFPKILAPLSGVYASAGRKHRSRAKPREISIPVICIGNIVSGGSGKTPTAIAISNLVGQHKISLSPFFLTRGYRGKVEGPERVDDSHDPALWGDEAILLARTAPTIVSKNRYLGGVLAQDLEADLVIMDDGMQNYSLKKDLTFCVIDGGMGFGNGKIVPAGPLRQSLEDGFSLSDAFILIGDDIKNVQAQLPAGKPVFKASLQISNDHQLSTETPYIAFCGIGYPDKFKASLQATGLKIIDFKAFADHHDYTDRDIENLITLAAEKEARLITTQKDFARLPDFFQKNLIDVLPVQIVFEDTDSLVNYIKDKISP